MTEAKTPKAHGAMLRNLAEMTASGTRNWQNFEEICSEMISAAFKAGARHYKQLLVDNEVKYLLYKDEASPEVGMGLTPETARHKALEHLGFTEEELK